MTASIQSYDKFSQAFEKPLVTKNLLCYVLQHLESAIKSRIPGIRSLITKTIAELETELHRLGKPIAADAGVKWKIGCK